MVWVTMDLMSFTKPHFTAEVAKVARRTRRFSKAESVSRPRNVSERLGTDSERLQFLTEKEKDNKQMNMEAP